MNIFLRDQLVRKCFSIGGGGGGGGNSAAETTRRMDRYVADTQRDGQQLIGDISAIAGKLETDVKSRGRQFLASMSNEEKIALNRLEEANNWLSTQSEKVGGDFSNEIDRILSDLSSASKTLNAGERDAVDGQIAAFRREAAALDTSLISGVESALTRMDTEGSAATDRFRQDSDALGADYLSAVNRATDEYRSIMGEATSLSPERINLFTNAARQLSLEAVKIRGEMLAEADPRALELSAIADENAAAMMSGRISADTQANLARSSAMRALQGGFGASSEMGRGLAARDLGLTSLELQQRGMNDYERQRVLNYNSRVAGLQTDSEGLLQANQNLLTRRAENLFDAGLKTSEFDRNQRQGVLGTALASDLARVDTRRAENIGLAKDIFASNTARSRELLGLGISNTQNFFGNERKLTSDIFNVQSDRASKMLGIGLDTMGSLYKTNTTAAGDFYTTNANALGSVYTTDANVATRAAAMREGARTNAFNALTNVRAGANSQIERAYQQDAMISQQNKANQNSMWGSIISTGATLAGAAVGALAGGVGAAPGAAAGAALGGALTGASVGGALGSGASGILGFNSGGGSGGISSLGSAATALANRGVSGSSYTGLNAKTGFYDTPQAAGAAFGRGSQIVRWGDSGYYNAGYKV